MLFKTLQYFLKILAAMFYTLHEILPVMYVQDSSTPFKTSLKLVFSDGNDTVKLF